MVYRIDNFIENTTNPITNCEYDMSWIVLILTDSDEYQQFVGSKNGCAYTIKVSRFKCKDWMIVIGDFIREVIRSTESILTTLFSRSVRVIKKIFSNGTGDSITLCGI